MSGGELFVHLKLEPERRFTESRVRFYAAEITSALGYLHERGVIYRDLKLENLLLDRNGHIKMVDFGLCKDEIFGKMETSTFCGTPSYLPPEVLRSRSYGRPVDWWGLGVVTYELLTGQLPFYAEERKQMFRQIIYDQVHFPRHFSYEAREFVSKLLVKDPARRLGSGGDAQEIMAQPFFATIDWAQLYRKRLPPPFKPELSSEVDTRYVDPEFAGDCHALTPPGSDHLTTSPPPTSAFSEFSYRNSGSILSRDSQHSVRSMEVA